ncbi:Uncharacterized protein GBIM_13628 [Gryllus bimaculatus]|nr:Uncharacterized protein GBIM_13628 [Gryllus bimaculatus]
MLLSYEGLLGVALLLELAISLVAMRGSILDTAPRASMQYLLYARLALMALEVVWLVLGVLWLVRNYTECPTDRAKDAMLGLVICSWSVVLSVLLSVWCTFDAAGRSWVKMKEYQRSQREAEAHGKFHYKRSGSRHRNWRQRKVIRAYQDSWNHRCRLLFCCMGNSDRNRNSFADIARLLSDFFRDLDVVPSDVVAGLVLLRKFQKIERSAIVKERKNDTYEYLSGVPVTSQTQFLALNDPEHLAHFQVGEVEVVYATYHVDVGETPFFVAVDYSRRKVVVSIRGTLSLQDVITDLNAEGEQLPVAPPREDWLGHKIVALDVRLAPVPCCGVVSERAGRGGPQGMVQAAAYIRDKLREERILERAFERDAARGTPAFDLVLVGHSLGAGTASILAILLRTEQPGLQCFAYSPPGGTLSMPAAEYTKSFITSVVLGKDVVPRIGLHQLEALRADLINTIKRSKDPKWKTIFCSVVCCGCAPLPTSVAELQASDVSDYQKEKEGARELSMHPSDSSIALTMHQPLYPPGRIIHIVRHHPTKGEQKYEKRWRQVLNKHEPVYQAVWANTTDFDEVLISPVMIQDHMPDNVLEALNKVVSHAKRFNAAVSRPPANCNHVSPENCDTSRGRAPAAAASVGPLQVITTVGPAKPQRAPSAPNSLVTSAEHLDSERCHLLAPLPPATCGVASSSACAGVGLGERGERRERRRGKEDERGEEEREREERRREER